MTTSTDDEICVVYDFCHINGGAAKVAIETALGLRQRGYSVSFFGAVGPIDERLAASGVRVTCLNMAEALNMRPRWLGCLYPVARRALREHLNSSPGGVSAVHLHGWTKALSISIFGVLSETSATKLVTLHDYFATCPNGGHYNYRRNAICRLRPLSSSCVLENCDSRNFGFKAFRVIRSAFNRVIGYPSSAAFQLVTVSKFAAGLLNKYLPTTATVAVLPNPIVVEKQPRVCAERNTDFVFLGRNSPEKGLDDLVSACIQAGASLTIIGGETDPKYQDHPSLRLIPWCDPRQISEYLAGARAVIVPSRWYETQGLVAKEAIARGLPVVCGSETAMTDFIVDDVCGVIYEQGSVDSLASALCKLMSSDELVGRLSRESYSRYWEAPDSMDSYLDALVVRLSIRNVV
jgi:glycosyltransferase involved in cell wall biosynthesis